VDLFGSEAAAGKSLGTDLAKGKLTLPVLLLWERANGADRGRLEALVQDCRNGALSEVTGLLSKYETLAPSLKSVHQYLETARQALCELPESRGRESLQGVTEYLARQTDALGEPCVKLP
jgi:octaprenyl-diphosphate synthase